MINQVGNYAYQDVYAPLQKNGASYAISKPFTDTQKNEVKKEEEKKTSKFGYSVAAIALIAGLGYFGFGKLTSKGVGSKVKEIAKRWGEKVEKSGAKGFFTSIKQMGRTILNKSQVIFNIATFKDIVFVKGLKKVSFLKGLNEKVTGFFERVSVGTSRRAYAKTLASFDSMFARFAEADSKIKGKIPSEQARLIAEKIKSVRENYTLGFSETARNERFARVQEGLKDFDERIWKQTYGDLGAFWKQAKKGEFVAEREAHQTKDILKNVVSGFKEKITNSSIDCSNVTSNLFNRLNSRLNIKDEQSKILLDRLKKHFASYKSALESASDSTKLSGHKDDLVKTLQELDTYIAKPNKFYTPENTKEMSQAIKDLTSALRENKKGEIQEIMDIYKQHLSSADYEKLQKSVDKSLKSLNKSIDLESDKLFDKIRDLKLGSAPHDVLAFLASLGLIGWGVSKADSKDEKISVTLKYGIPALFGVMTAIACTVGLVASGPSLLIGLASTIPINMIGKAIDNLRKKNNEDPQAKILPTINFESPMQMIRDIENNNKKKLV